jgi:predicted metal-dependent enzyme (double-stranded beta helix superfamily)
MPSSLSDFVSRCQRRIAGIDDPHACVDALIPIMRDMLVRGPVPLEPQHRRPDDDSYARHPIFVDGDDDISLLALVWQPGQWTPVHDHGTWGVVGVVDGVLEERAYLMQGGDPAGNAGFRLTPHIVSVLAPGDVVGFAAEPEHIHMVGVPHGRPTCISLHLYGRRLSQFHIYDPATGTRRRVDPTHH